MVSFLLIASVAAAREITETAKTVHVDVPFDIRLVTNPSTGYSWMIDTAASQGLESLKVEDLGVSPAPQRDGRALVGAPVIQTWLVTPHVRGAFRLVLIYQRPWENRPPEKSHVFNISVAE